MDKRQAFQLPSPLPPNESRVPEYLGLLTTFLVLSLVFFAGRIYTRAIILGTLWWDDAAISLGIISTIVDWIIQIVMVQYGFGHRIFYLTPQKVSTQMKLMFVAMLILICAITFVKISLGLLLLRIKREGRWKLGLWILVVSQLVFGIAAAATQLMRCKPVAANWSQIPGAKCWARATMEMCYYLIAALFIASDLVFALLPIAFIYNLRRPIREKIALVLLMGSGLFATACSIVKVESLHRITISQDPGYDSIDANIWVRMELYVGIIAACVPCLKGPFERVLVRFNLLSFNSRYTVSSASKPEQKSARQRTKIQSVDPLKQSDSDVELVTYKEIGPTASGSGNVA